MNYLLETIQSHVENPLTAGLIIETKFSPLNGPGAPVAPPTYAGEGGESRSSHAVANQAFVPARDDRGWFSTIERESNGQPRLARRVVIDSYGSQSGRVETALWRNQDRLGISLPALIVGGDSFTEDVADSQIAQALQIEINSWETAHRHTDSWFRFASEDGSTKQIWQDDQSETKKLILTSSAENPVSLYEHFVNSALFGFWLSSGTAQRHRLARAYSSEIVGYGAHPVESGATKLDAAGGASKDIKLSQDSSGAIVVSSSTRNIKKAEKPSVFGFGPIPSSPAVRSFVCELILQQSSISLGVLRTLKFSEEQKNNALTVLVLLAMAGHMLNREESFLRSGCALVPESERWGWKQQFSSVEPLDTVTLNDITAALGDAINEAEAVGLKFAPPIHLMFSQTQRTIIKNRVTAEEKTKTDSGSES